MTQAFTKRRLPHWYVPGAAHFVTFRLAGSLPAVVLDELRQRKELLLRQKPAAGQSSSDLRQRIHKQLFAEYDRYLDEHRDVSWLADARVAASVRGSIHKLHDWKYGLLAYSIMPNHVHIMIVPKELPADPRERAMEEDDIGETPDKRSSLSSIMHSLKGYTAHEANRILRREGCFWQHESYDHWVRDDDELERIVEYINRNAVAANLSLRAHEYFWCSAHDRFLMDGETTGWLGFDNVG